MGCEIKINYTPNKVSINYTPNSISIDYCSEDIIMGNLIEDIHIEDLFDNDDIIINAELLKAGVAYPTGTTFELKVEWGDETLSNVMAYAGIVSNNVDVQFVIPKADNVLEGTFEWNIEVTDVANNNYIHTQGKGTLIIETGI